MDILVNTDTKFDDTLPTSYFLANGFSIPDRLEREGELCFVFEMMFCKHVLQVDFSALFIDWAEF